MFTALGSGFRLEGCIVEPIRVSAGLQAFEQRLIGVFESGAFYHSFPKCGLGSWPDMALGFSGQGFQAWCCKSSKGFRR